MNEIKLQYKGFLVGSAFVGIMLALPKARPRATAWFVPDAVFANIIGMLPVIGHRSQEGD